VVKNTIWRRSGSAYDEELRKWEEEALELIKKINYAEYIDGLPRLSDADSRELRKLFRQLVRRLHPDLNPKLPENFQYLWARVLAFSAMANARSVHCH